VRAHLRNDEREARIGSIERHRNYGRRVCCGQRVSYLRPMKLTDERTAGAHVVRSYAPGEIRVGEHVLTGSCLISATQLITDWRPQSVETLELTDVEPLLALKPEIVVLGAGTRQRFPSAQWMAALLSRGIGCEVMDTGAACRTYNVLVSESRNVVAALFVR
jgi:uncharacterized protein